MLLQEKLHVQEKEMQENDLKDPEKLLVGEGVPVHHEEELHEELAVEELHEELAVDLQEDVRQYDAKLPPIFYSNFAKSLWDLRNNYELTEIVTSQQPLSKII